MKKVFRTIALVSIIGLTATSCQGVFSRQHFYQY